MDISHPLAGAPLFENTATTTRHGLNTTKQRADNPRYWINIGRETSKGQNTKCWAGWIGINTLTRPNLMAPICGIQLTVRGRGLTATTLLQKKRPGPVYVILAGRQWDLSGVQRPTPERVLA